MLLTAWKVAKYGAFSGPNTGKFGPEKTLYLDTFHAVVHFTCEKIFTFLGRLSSNFVSNIERI